jgi:hypothetical protein
MLVWTWVSQVVELNAYQYGYVRNIKLRQAHFGHFGIFKITLSIVISTPFQIPTSRIQPNNDRELLLIPLMKRLRQ